MVYDDLYEYEKCISDGVWGVFVVGIRENRLVEDWELEGDLELSGVGRCLLL